MFEELKLVVMIMTILVVIVLIILILSSLMKSTIIYLMIIHNTHSHSSNKILINTAPLSINTILLFNFSYQSLYLVY